MAFRNLYDYVYVARNVIKPDQIREILKESEQLQWYDHHWVVDDEDQGVNTYSREDGTELSVATPADDSELALKMAQAVAVGLFEYSQKIQPNSWIEELSTPRFNKYTKNTDMANHVDHIMDIFCTTEELQAGIRKGIPIVSCVAVLTDDYEGGEFIFNNEYEVKLNAGDVLMFPSAYPWEHRVNTVTNGTRISYVTWGY